MSNPETNGRTTPAELHTLPIGAIAGPFDKTTVALTLKSAYGITRAYPSNTLAEQLAEFAQVVTFTQRHIMLLGLMGFTLKVTDGLSLGSVP